MGFGVSGPEQARNMISIGAEGVIVGSALVRALGEAPSEVWLSNFGMVAYFMPAPGHHDRSSIYCLARFLDQKHCFL